MKLYISWKLQFQNAPDKMLKKLKKSFYRHLSKTTLLHLTENGKSFFTDEMEIIRFRLEKIGRGGIE